MKQIKKVAATVLLVIGLPISLTFGYLALSQELPRQEREGMVGALLLLGLPPTVGGAWLVWSLRQQHQQELRDRLHTAFSKLLQANDGNITVLSFSMETQLSGKDAKAFLDERAQEFNATFQVGEAGGVVYCFDLGKVERD